MSNQLSIPFKRTEHILIREAVRAYIQSHHADTHPDAFKWDVTRWEQLRESGTGGVVHISRIDATLKYHAQLVFILTKIPADIGLDIPYSAALMSSSPTISLVNLAYERVAVLFNLASLYSQLAKSEDRSHADGIKRATSYYQNAAGTLSYLIISALPQFKQSLVDQQPPEELTEPVIKSLETLMLAQAQECAWQRAVMDHYKNGAIAKLSSKASSLYELSSRTIRESYPPVTHAFPAEWLIHIDTKHHHFAAAAQYRKSMDDLEANKYGPELARLLEAQTMAKKGYDIARRGLVARPVLEDIKANSLSEIVQKNIARAERDNDLIYHQDVPPASALPAIPEVALVQSAVPMGLRDPKIVLGHDDVVFGELVGWGAGVAVEIYRDRLQNWLKDEVYDRAKELDNSAAGVLQSLNLPASLEALDKPIGLPPSLLKKADEVRLEDGPSRIEASIEDVELLAERDRAVLNEAMDILDQEASEDEGIRHTFAKNKRAFSRLPSHEANKELGGKEKRYRQILEQAADSDEQVRGKWNEWEETITRLTWDEADLERWVPSSTATTTGKSRKSNSETEMQARALRVQLEALDDVQNARGNLVQRARRLADADDIRPRIMREASAIGGWTEVEPIMFEETLDQELNKYEKFKEGIEDGAFKQEEIIEVIKSHNQQFLQSRQEDEAVKDREHALQSLDLAYHKYREITRNLDEGLKFYNDLANILTMFREACREWVRSRRDEIGWLSESLDAVDLHDVSQAPEPNPRPVEDDTSGVTAELLNSSSVPKPPPGHRKVALNLPPPDSDEWETVPMPSRPASHSIAVRKPVLGASSTPRRSTRTGHSETAGQ